jgi:hypothetical protein
MLEINSSGNYSCFQYRRHRHGKLTFPEVFVKRSKLNSCPIGLNISSLESHSNSEGEATLVWMEIPIFDLGRTYIWYCRMCCLELSGHVSWAYWVLRVGFHMGTGISAVFPKWVTCVRVRYWILAHRAHRVPVPRCHGYSRVNYVIIVSLFIVILMYLHLFILICLPLGGTHKKRLEFETPTNATNHCVCFHPVSHLINSKCEDFGPLHMNLREGLRAREVDRMGVGRD